MDSINTNEVVWVRLSETGVAQHRKWGESLSIEGIEPTPKVGELLRLQLHELMHIFGPVLILGNDVPFEGNRVYFRDSTSAVAKEVE